MRKVVVYMGDKRLYNDMETACKSLLHHTPVDQVVFLIDTHKFPRKLPKIVSCIDVSHQTIFPVPGPNYHPHYGYMTWMRAALTKVLPDEHVVLLLDPDTLVVDDISGIWDYDISNYYLAAVQETRFFNMGPIHKKSPYFNAGVMLLNLDKLRADAIDNTIIHTINTVHYQHLEQDVINYTCDKHILSIPSEYNTSFVTELNVHPRIRHFLSYAKDELPTYAEPYEQLKWKDVRFVKGVKSFASK